MWRIAAIVYLGTIVAHGAEVRIDGVCSQKNQGALGTCHAFGLTCPVEAFEAKRRPGFVVSENWLVFLSTLDRLCSRTADRVRVNQGYVGWYNTQRMMTLGYCAKSTYSSYDPNDGARGVGDWRPAPVEVDKLLAGDSGMATMARGVMDPYVAKKFEAAFGISPEDAKGALCEGSDAQKKARLSTMKVSRQFRACFDESMKTKPTLAGACKPSFGGGGGGDARMLADIKAKISRGEPVMIGLYNYRQLPNGAHASHFVSVVGFDDAKKQLIIRNSWGAGANYPVSYSRMGSIHSIFSLNCAGSGPTPPTPPRPPSRPPTRPSRMHASTRDGFAAFTH